MKILAIFFSIVCGFKLVPVFAEEKKTPGDFLNQRLSKGLLKLQSPKIYDDAGALKKVKIAWKDIPAQIQQVYEDFLKKNSLEAKDLDWQSQKLVSTARMAAPQPVDRFYNSHVLLAKDFIFRPVETSTGCDTGCTPVVFHLVFNNKGKFVDLLTETKRPLRKIYHQELSGEDFARLKKVLTDMPVVLGGLTSPLELTDSFSGTPPRTHSVFNATLVKGGAYTSFKIFEAAVKTSNFVMQPHLQINLDRATSQWTDKAFYLEDDKSLEEFMNKIIHQVKANQHQFDLNQYLKNLFSEFLLYYAQNKEKNNLVRLHLLDDKIFGPGYYCEIYEKILQAGLGEFFDSKTYSFLPVCKFPNSKEWFKYLSYVQTENKGKLIPAKEVPEFLKNAPPDFVFRSKEIAQLYVKLMENYKAPHQERMAEISLRYPELNVKNLDAMALNKAQEKLNAELLKHLQMKSERSSLPGEFLNLEVTQGEKTVRVSEFLSAKKPKLLMFFARWCPHCQHTIDEILSTEKGKKLFSEVSLIEVFNRGGEDLNEFCADRKIESSQCKKIAIIKESPKLEAAYEKLDLMGVPRFMLLDADNKVATYQLDIDPNKFVHDVSIFLEMLK